MLSEKMMERLPEIREPEPGPQPYFPTPEEQEKARDVIIRGWDAIGVEIVCPPPQLSPRPPISLKQSSAPQLSTVP
jgi:putative spermidine/putrescine transport system substrate-binding protein